MINFLNRICKKTVLSFKTTILFALFSITFTFSQSSCPCESATEIVLCYLPKEIYCDENATVSYSTTLDDTKQRDGFVEKLMNISNFGLSGLYPCEIRLTPIR